VLGGLQERLRGAFGAFEAFGGVTGFDEEYTWEYCRYVLVDETGSALRRQRERRLAMVWVQGGWI
jgi:hypothetical protein